MVLFELDDFDYWVDISVTGDELVFSPIFVFILYWALCENKLSEELLSEASFIKELTDLTDSNNSFSSFVEKELDGKICDSYFDESVRQFVSDYYEYDGYTDDLVKFFNRNLWELPQSLDKANDLNKLINTSLKNYRANLKKRPDIIDFTNNQSIN